MRTLGEWAFVFRIYLYTTCFSQKVHSKCFYKGNAMPMHTYLRLCIMKCYCIMNCMRMIVGAVDAQVSSGKTMCVFK